jgi:dienelactone hydrolase
MPRMTPPHTSRRLSFLGIIALTGFSLLLLAASASADIVFMDDGFVLRGKIQREGFFHWEAADVWVPKAGGFYVVEDGLRRVVFNQRYVSEALPEPGDTPQMERIEFRASGITAQSKVLHSFLWEEIGPWDRDAKGNPTKTNGQRLIKIRMGDNLVANLEQWITDVTPQGVRMSTGRYRWRACYRTQEFDTTELLGMIRKQLETGKKNAAEPPLARRLRLFRFCAQAGWFDIAEAEMKALQADFPKEKETLRTAHLELRRIVASKRLEEMQQAERVGQWLRLRQLLAEFVDDGVDDLTLTKVHVLRSRVQEQTADLEAVRRCLGELRRQLTDMNYLHVTKGMLDEIDQCVNLDTAPRLAAMLTLAKQEENRRQRSLPLELNAEQLLSLALSGWILGAPGAEPRTDIALELCRAREFLKAYLRQNDPGERDKLLEVYLRQSPVTVDVMMQIIRLLPPQGAEPLPPNNVLEARTPPATHWKNGVPYRVQLPPEYHHHRTYPLLVVLPNLGDTPKEELQRWGDLAARQGFILAIVEWADGTKAKYGANAQEWAKDQEAVLATLKDLRRKYCVDSDRVFLAGQGVAGQMTYDVALTFPDQFAAAVVMCGHLSGTTRALAANAQNLPFYVVDGDKAPNRPQSTRGLFEEWIQMGFPCMYVEYQGRTHEAVKDAYKGELPIITDWLQRRKRSRALPELGKPGIANRQGREFCTFRDTARHFYWLSTEGKVPAKEGIELAAHVNQGNALAVYTTNAAKVTVWLNSAMVDFEQPIEIVVNPRSGSGRRFQKKLSPNPRVLLEDFHERQDRSMLFMARVDFDLTK